jgi:hypothetical protein
VKSRHQSTTAKTAHSKHIPKSCRHKVCQRIAKRYAAVMGFFNLSERVNALLYRQQIGRLTREDLELATHWTLQLIRDRHPHWTEAQVQEDYDRLLKVRVVAIDQWSARLGEVRSI